MKFHDLKLILMLFILMIGFYSTKAANTFIDLLPILPNDSLEILSIKQDDFDSTSIAKYQTKIEHLFPTDAVFEMKYYSVFKNELKKVYSEPYKVRILFTLFKKHLNKQSKKCNTCHDKIKYDKTIQAPLEKELVKKWTEDALDENIEYITQLYSDYFPENLDHGTNAIFGINENMLKENEDLIINVNAKPDFKKERKVLSIKAKFDIYKFNFKSPFIIDSIEKILSKSVVADSTQFSFPIAIKEPGIYKVIASTEDCFKQYYFRVTSLSGVMKIDYNKISLFPRSKDISLLKNCNYLVFNKKRCYFGNTSDDGIGVIKSIEKPFKDDIKVILEKDGHYAFFEKKIYSDLESIRSTFYLYTDRPVYKPKDTVFIGGMSKTFINDTYFDGSTIDSVTVIGKDYSSRLIYSEQLAINKWGHFYDTLPLPANFKSGDINFEIIVPKDLKYPIKEKLKPVKINVKTFAKSDFYAVISTNKSVYNVGDTIKVKVNSRYHFGKPYQYEKISIRALNKNSKQINYFETALDGEGEATYSFVVDSSYKMDAIKLMANVNGQATKPIEVSIIPQKDESSNELANNNIVETNNTIQRKPIIIIPNKVNYEFGDTAIVEISLNKDCDNTFISLNGSQLFSYYRSLSTAKRFILRVPIIEKNGNNLMIEVISNWGDKSAVETKNLKVKPGKSNLCNINLKHQESYSPGEKYSAEITVEDRDGNPIEGEISLAIVDEAIYSIKDDNDIGIFSLYPKKYKNRVITEEEDTKTGHFLFILDRFMSLNSSKANSFIDNSNFNYPYAHRREASLKSFYPHGYDDLIGSLMGGDGGSLNLKKRGSLRVSAPMFTKGGALLGTPNTRKVFKDLAYWNPSLVTSKKGKAKIDFTLPDNLTEWRMCFRGSDGKKRLIKENNKFKTVIPLMVRIISPPFFISNDSSIIYAAVHNYSDLKQNGKLRFTAKTKDNKNALVDSTLDVELNVGEVALFSFPTAIATTDSIFFNAAIITDSLSDAMEIGIPINNRNQRKRTYKSSTLSLNTISDTLKFNIPNSADQKERSLSIWIGHDKSNLLINSINYLLSYRYGCVEQTMNKFIPNIAVANCIDIFDLDRDSLLDVFDEATKRGLKRIEKLQHSDGLWGWFKTDSTNLLMTALVFNGLDYLIKSNVKDEFRIHAKEMMEQSLPNAIKLLKDKRPQQDGWLNLVSSIKTQNDLKVFLPELKDLYGKQSELSLYDNVLLAESFYNLKMKKELSTLCRYIQDYSVNDMDGTFWDIEKTCNMKYWECNNINVTISALEILIKENPQNSIIPDIIKWIYSKYNGTKWICTRTTGDVIKSLCTYYSKTKVKKSKLMYYDLSLNNKIVYKSKVKNSDKNIADRVLNISLDSLNSNNVNLVLNKKNEEILYWNASLDYYEPILTSNRKREPVTIKRMYTIIREPEYSEFKERNEFNGTGKVGDIFEVLLEIDSKFDYDYVLIEDGIPAGASLLSISKGQSSNSDMLIDKAVFMKEKLKKGKNVFRYKFQLQTPGVYTIPSTYLELMSQPDINYSSEKSWIKIYK